MRKKARCALHLHTDSGHVAGEIGSFFTNLETPETQGEICRTWDEDVSLTQSRGRASKAQGSKVLHRRIWKSKSFLELMTIHAALPGLTESVVGLQSRAGAMTGSWGRQESGAKSQRWACSQPCTTPAWTLPKPDARQDRVSRCGPGTAEEKMGWNWRPGSSDPGV